MSRLTYVLPGEDEPIGRFLALTLVVFLLLSGFRSAGLLLFSAFVALGVWLFATAIQGLWVGYLESKTE